MTGLAQADVRALPLAAGTVPTAGEGVKDG